MNIRKQSQEDAKKISGRRKFFAHVVSTSGGTIKVQHLGQSLEDDQFYPAASGLAASVTEGDLVVCSLVGAVIVVEYKVATS